MKPEHIFHEIYGAYFITVQRIINAALDKRLQRKDVEKIIRTSAFQETPWLLMERIERGDFGGVLDKDYTTSICALENRPMTEIERRWLKTISLDPRIRLFEFDFSGLDNIEPLYTQEDLLVCGQYGNGDNYNNVEYQEKFKVILKCLRENKTILLSYTSAHYEKFNGEVYPLYLQYSLKEDVFRLVAVYEKCKFTYNLSRMDSCKIGKHYDSVVEYFDAEQSYVEVSIENDRQTLERFLLYFANYERKTTAIDDKHFIVKMRFPKQDETEVLINILSFAPMAKIVAPSNMLAEFKRRMQKQAAFLRR